MIASPEMSPAAVKELLEHCPVEPGPIQQGLVGWVTKEGHKYCAICIGRLIQRGMSARSLGCSIPIWSQPVKCEACGFELDANRTRKA